MFSEIALGVWSALGISWSILSLRLVRPHAAPEDSPGPLQSRSLSIFKPLPLLGAPGLHPFEAGLESFVSQLDPASELLLGIHEADRATVAPFLARMSERHPQSRLQPIFRTGPDTLPNPKIAWQKLLASHATGELWLWSDADIVAPPHFLRRALAEFETGAAGMLTFPYVVREVRSAPALLDALFVNVEFYPGVRLLQRVGPVDFGLGAGMLFRRDDFVRAVEWTRLGSALADDFELGQLLKPVRLSKIAVTTVADVATWRAALGHYLRWSKTVRWNRPGGAAARIVVLPVAGWLACVAMHPASIVAWAGLLGMMQLEVVAAAALLRKVGCPVKVGDLLTVESWTLGRVLVWLASWLPWPVFWKGRKWWKPHQT